MSYDTFYPTMTALPAANQASLWRRTMVLGPTPEFALLSPSPLQVPDTFQPLHLNLSPVWSSQ
jgi:hypothetical protein